MWKAASVDFMCITAWTPYIGEQIDCALHGGYRIPSLLQFRMMLKRLVMCRRRSLVSPRSSCEGTERYPARLQEIEEVATIYRRVPPWC